MHSIEGFIIGGGFVATTTLRAYLDDLNLLLEQEALEEVIGHCRHILQHFPKNVDTYRFLGRALLEKGRHQEASDVFQRVLSAIPDDFTSHLGLSAYAEEQTQIRTAIWHLERAFEQDPHNMALQNEMKRLYERLGSTPPERFQLTRGALARFHIKGKLFDQAITELQNAINATPDRLDLVVLLVQALRESDHLLQAGEIAFNVLDRLPDNIEANRVHAMIWLRSARPSDAAPFVSRLEQLDPFLAWQVVNPDMPVPKEAFQLPRLRWDARAAAALATDVPDWVSNIGDVFDAPDSVNLGSTADWMSGAFNPGSTPSTSNRYETPRDSGLLRKTGNLPPLPDQQAQPVPTIPDWFNDVLESSDVDDSSVSGSTDKAAVPVWMDDALDFDQGSTTNEGQSAGIVAPNWLDDDLDNRGDSADNADMPSGFTDLLANSANRNQPSAPPQTNQAGLSAVPDWLEDALPASPTSQPPATSEVQPLDALSWLNTGPLPSLDEPTQNWTPEAITDNPKSPSSSVPDWLADAVPSNALPAAPGFQAPDEEEPEPLNALDWLNTGPLANATPQEDDSFVSVQPQQAVPTPHDQHDQMDVTDLSWLNSAPEPTVDSEFDRVTAPTTENAGSEADEMPDLSWLNNAPDLSALSAAGPDAPEPTTSSFSSDLFASNPGSGGLETPDEFAELFETDNNTVSPATNLDWLNDAPHTPMVSATPQPDDAPAEDPLAWMKAAGLTPLAEPEEFRWTDGDDTKIEPVTDDTATAEDPLAWMKAAGITPIDAVGKTTDQFNDSGAYANLASGATQSTPTAAGEPVNPDEMDPLAWMKAAGISPIESASANPVDDNGLDWMDQPEFASSGAEDAVNISNAETTPPVEEFDEHEMPAWMREAGFQEPEPAEPEAPAANVPKMPSARLSQEPALDWLSGMSNAPLGSELTPNLSVTEVPTTAQTTGSESSGEDLAGALDLSWLDSMSVAPETNAPIQPEPSFPSAVKDTRPDEDLSSGGATSFADELGFDWLNTPGDTISGQQEPSPTIADMSAEPSPTVADDNLDDLSLDWLAAPGTPLNSDTLLETPKAEATQETSHADEVPPVTRTPSGRINTDELESLRMDWLSAPGNTGLLDTELEFNSGDADTGITGTTGELESLRLDWLNTPGDTGALDTESTHDVVSAPESIESTGNTGELDPLSLDWLGASDLGNENITEAASFTSGMPDVIQDRTDKSTQSDGLDWLNNIGNAPAPQQPAAEGTWLDSLANSGTFASPGNVSSVPAADQPLESAPVEDDDAISWMKQFGVSPLTVDDQLSQPGEDFLEGEHLEQNDLSQLLGTSSGVTADLFAPKDEPDALGLPDWMNTLAPSGSVPAGESAPDINALDFGALNSFEQAIPNDSADENDWLNQISPPISSTVSTASTFNHSILESETTEPALDWLSQANQSEDDWLASIGTAPAEVERTQEPTDLMQTLLNRQKAANDVGAPDWLKEIPTEEINLPETVDLTPPEEIAPPADATAAIASLDEDTPDWMRQPEQAGGQDRGTGGLGWLPPEGKEQFNTLLQMASQKANEPRKLEDTGILNNTQLPDWLDAFSEDPEAMKVEPEPEVIVSETPKRPSTPIDTLDWSTLGSEPAQEEPVAESTDAPDWLASISSAQPATEPPTPELAMLENLDFTNLLTTNPVTSEASEAAILPTQAQDTTPVAKPDVVVNTINTVEKTAENPLEGAGKTADNLSSVGFKFDKRPAWMRKKQAADTASTQVNTEANAVPEVDTKKTVNTVNAGTITSTASNPPMTPSNPPLPAPAQTEAKQTTQPTPDPAPTNALDDDFADLLRNLTGSPSDGDLPDWLKE